MTASTPLAARGRLKTRHLLLLLHLDEQRSVLRAARAANMTQPGASKLLAELEESLGVTLFHRHSRGVEPTWYGEIMMRHARTALAEMDRAHEEILALKSGLTGEASIGAVANPGVSLVPEAVAQLKGRHPLIRIGIDISSSDELVSRLLKGELDMVVARVPETFRARDLEFQVLAGETHRITARVGHPLFDKRRVDLPDLVDQAWILPPVGSLIRDRIDSIFVHRGLGAPRNVVETLSIPVITGLLQRTDMISALQGATAAPYYEGGLLAVLPLKLDVRMEPFGIVTRRNHPLSPGATAMLECLREVAARMYRDGQAVAPGKVRRPGKR